MVRLRRMDDLDVVEVRWWGGRRNALAWYGLLFAGVLTYLGAPPGQFTGVYKGLMLSAAALLTYLAAARLLNRSRAYLKGGELVVEHGPLPLRSGGRLALDDIRSLAVEPNSGGWHGLTHDGGSIDVFDDLSGDAEKELPPLLRLHLSQGPRTDQPQATDQRQATDRPEQNAPP